MISLRSQTAMAGLVLAIHAQPVNIRPVLVDARVERGHDGTYVVVVIE